MYYGHNWPRAILHVDGDAFFASCEQAIHPEWKGRPVITGKERGIVAAASYEAKALGIGRGVKLWDVRKICPDAIIVPSDYETYSIFSKRMFAIMRRFTPVVEEYSIDEGFADITGLRRPMRASYEAIAQNMKESIESELGLTVSIGLSVSKVLAKIGSKFNKPSGLTVIPGRQIENYLRQTPLEKVWGIGPRTTAYCEKMRLKTALDFARQTEGQVRRRFTKPHIEIWRELNGEQIYEVTTEEKHSYLTIAKTKTFTPPSSDYYFTFAQLVKNLENACIKLRRHNLVAKNIVIYLREQTFEGRGIEATLSRASAFQTEIIPALRVMFEKIFNSKKTYRATGVILTGLMPKDNLQMSLFDSPAHLEKMERMFGSIDALADKFGKHTVHLLGAHQAHVTPQHILERGDVPERKLNRLKDESYRKHLSIPFILKTVK